MTPCEVEWLLAGFLCLAISIGSMLMFRASIRRDEAASEKLLKATLIYERARVINEMSEETK